MAESKLEPLTPIGHRYLRYMLSIGVSLAVGLAPLLGKVGVPGFTPIIEVFPMDMRGGALIAFASFLMTLPAVAVQFYAGNAIAVHRVDRWFAPVLLALVPLTMLLYYIYSNTTTTVPIEEGRMTAVYVVGDEFLDDCPCKEARLRIQKCIGHAITTNYVEVYDCYDRSQINRRRNSLGLLYLLVMLGFGALIGLIVLKDLLRRATKRRAAATGAA